jgi:hypothetical protein
MNLLREANLAGSLLNPCHAISLVLVITFKTHISMKAIQLFVLHFIFITLSITVLAAVDPIVYIQGSRASSIFDGIDFYGLEPSGGTYYNEYVYYPTVVFDLQNSSVPQNAAVSYEWIVVGGTAVSAKTVSYFSAKWNNTINYSNGVPTKTIRLKVTYTWTPQGGSKQTKVISSVRSNGANEAQPIEVKYISDPSTITFNGSTLSNNNTLSYTCGAAQKTISIPAVTTDPGAPVTYYFFYPNGWTGPASSNVPSVTVNTHINQGGTLKVEAKRNDSNNFRTKISITITRPLPTKPVINSPDILLCSPQTITASASNATSYNWTSTGGITANSPGNTNSAQITGVSDGTVMVSATSSVCALTTASSNPINVKRSAPLPASLLVTANGGGSPDFMCNGAGVMLNAYTAEPGTQFGIWTSSDPGNTILNSNGGTAYFNSYVNNCYGIDITVSNCFGSVQKGITICVDNCAKGAPIYKVFPNPAKDQVKIQFDDVAKEALPQVIKLFSEIGGKEVRSVQVGEQFEGGSFDQDKTITLSVSDLPRGTYYLRLVNRDSSAENVRLILE